MWGKILTLVSISSRRKLISQALHQCRQKTLDLLTEIDTTTFVKQAHPDFSPIGWHFGHIAFTEAYWILEYLQSRSPLFSQYQSLFAADGLPKAERQNLPSLGFIKDYLAVVRNEVNEYLKIAPLETEERLWWWLIQHESQHNEIITFIEQLHLRHQNLTSGAIDFSSAEFELNVASLEQKPGQNIPNLDKMVKVEAGEFIMGSDAIYAQDNERSAHKLYLDTYWIDPYPVTCQQYREFILAGGYQNQHYWSEIGWQWLQTNPVSHPVYWSNSPEWDNHPVCGVSYYEAYAYAKFVGKRLPTEAEWAKAAGDRDRDLDNQSINSIETFPEPLCCNHDRLIGHTTPVNAYPANQSQYGCYDMLGNVWEWTASWFVGYKGFENYPYVGYSQAYFDLQHRVLRGGSWATRTWVLRASFRNWYNPWVREILAGFRCAVD